MQRLLLVLRHWTQGIRLYLAIGIGFVSLEVWWWGRATFGNSALATIRIQEVYAWISLGLLVITLLIGPVMKLLAVSRGKRLLADSRRALGIGAAWFALLHALVTYLVQFQATNPLTLPKIYQQSLLLGVVALLALLALAATSFDTAMRKMGVWWFRLHRLVYVAALLSLVHAFLIGAHATSVWALGALAVMAVVWTGCNAYLVGRGLRRGPAPSRRRLVALACGVVLLFASLGFGVVEHQRGARLAADQASHAEHGE